MRLSACAWPVSELGVVLRLLARADNLPVLPGEVPRSMSSLAGMELDRWLDAAAEHMGLAADLTEVGYRDLAALRQWQFPALVELPKRQGFLLCLATRGRTLIVLSPRQEKMSIPLSEVHACLGEAVETLYAGDIDRLLGDAEVPARRRAAAHRTLLARKLGNVRVARVWRLVMQPGRHFWQSLLRSGAAGKMGRFIAAHLVEYLLFLLSWYLIGKAALEGRLEEGWLWAWGLVLVTVVGVRSFSLWSEAVLNATTNVALKRRFLAGALRLSVDEVRAQGMGQALGKVIESDDVASFSLSGGLLAVTAVLDLLVSAFVLRAGAGGGVHVLLLVVWLAITAVLGARYVRRIYLWTRHRVADTHAIIEKIVGHETRFVQSQRQLWHVGEDEAVDLYARLSRELDTMDGWLLVLSRGWLVVSAAGLLPVIALSSTTATTIAIALGGMLLARQAMDLFASSFFHLAKAAVAMRQVAPLFRAATNTDAPGIPALAAAAAASSSPSRPLMEGHSLSYRYHSRATPVLESYQLAVHRGERLLLQGPSGSGKSTLSALLCGLREPTSGLLLLHGYDRATLGTRGWRQRVSSVPQYHENYVFTGSFVFNVLLGKRWPPQEDDLVEVERICRLLGLGALLDRMPAGIMQILGETGWQLSQGERSRLFIARALLRKPELIILDESFGPLDPATAAQCIEVVLGEVPTVMVIAHP